MYFRNKNHTELAMHHVLQHLRTLSDNSCWSNLNPKNQCCYYSALYECMSCETMLLPEPKKKVKSNVGAGNTNLVCCSCGLCWGHALGHGLWRPATNAKESKLASPHGGAFKNERKMSCCTFILLLNLQRGQAIGLPQDYVLLSLPPNISKWS
jgi:hypothetical protein